MFFFTCVRLILLSSILFSATDVAQMMRESDSDDGEMEGDLMWNHVNLCREITVLLVCRIQI